MSYHKEIAVKPYATIITLLLLTVACLLLAVWVLYLHPSVEWLQYVDRPEGYIILDFGGQTMACNHALQFCMSLP